MIPSRIWVTRARPGAEATSGRLTALGLTPLVAPLLEVRTLAAEIDLTGIDGLIFTSRNGVAAFTALNPDRARRVFTVGEATAHAAREAGFTDVVSAGGDLTALAALIRDEAPGMTLLHAAAAKPAGDLSTLVGDRAQVRATAVYETVETHAAPPKAWDTVLIHSPRAATAFAARTPDARGRLACAISTAAAAPLASLPFAEVRIAAAPTEDAVLETLGKPGPAV